MTHLGFIRAAAVTPILKVANTEFNTEKIIHCIKEAEKKEAGIIVLPELCITGCTCGDLFFQEALYRKQIDGLKNILIETKSIKSVVILGFYLSVENRFYNCAAILQRGQIKGIVPGMFSPSYRDSNQARWFAPGIELTDYMDSVSLFGQQVPIGSLLFRDVENEVSFGVEAGRDLYLPISPGTHLCLSGAHIICAPSSDCESVGRSEYRRNLLLQKSENNLCSYIFASSGVHESTTDQVYGGHCIITESRHLLNENRRFERESTITYSEIDFEWIKRERALVQGFGQCATAYSNRSLYRMVDLDPLCVLDNITNAQRSFSKTPFIPEDKKQANINCQEVFSIQTTALAKRIAHINAKKVVLGVSGGLDSTLALLVAAKSAKLLSMDASNIITVTMPGFGTTGKTYNNALTIMKLLGTEVREISIKESVLQHFKDIGHDPKIHNAVYENSQARERTQILMDIANKEGGLQLGTGDLSEVALGWSTYNGDHMGMYNVNASVPKTLLQVIIKWFIDYKLNGPDEDKSFSTDNALLASTLQDILDTPISPELLPPDKEGKIAQKTEDAVGPYILHDFFIYHTLRRGTLPKKLLEIAKITFVNEYDEDFIKKWLTVFYRRFFNHQFKRSCMPDGPKVGSVSLSPRGEWNMPSDGDVSIWLKELE
ncbi:MAG: NAD(+) synthase [Anaerovoracaceae bacterium]|jgi:NAD+ synthase (glutamine-hydrolysing)